MNDKPTSLMEFPCDFAIKVIGTVSENFAAEARGIVLKHYPNTNDSAISSKPSSQNNYLAITITVYAQDQASLDALYQELSAMPGVKMVL